MTDSPFDTPVTINTLRQFRQEGLLTAEAFTAAVRVLRPPSVWFAWAERNLLFFGSALMLSGIIFFFAYNWSAMGKFIKLGLIEAGLAACAAGAYWLGLHKLTGKVLLLSASVLVGVLLAVYGQTYQTGADAFELFVGWSALIFGWVLISDFAALWFIWLILVNTGVILFWLQVLKPDSVETFDYLCLFLAALNGSALALREVALKRGFAFLAGRWLRGILLLAVLVALSIPTVALIFTHYDTSGILSGVSALVWPVVAVGGYFCYRKMLPDMAALALILMNACVILLSFIGRLMFHHSGHDESLSFLGFALIIIGVVSVTAFWLKKTATRMSEEPAP